MKLDIKEVYIRNFRSFADLNDEEETFHKVNLYDRGPILVSGEIDDNSNKSNGSGKTTVVEAIIWCLFGRLSDKPRVGDHIVNNKYNKNCMVKIFTSDGYEIIRSRKYEGHSDLFIKKDGVDIDGGDSTLSNAQNFLNNLFNLNFDLFITSIFFGQSSGSFLSLSDAKKKDVIQNLFGLGKLNFYAKVAKEKISSYEKQYEEIKTKITNIDSKILSLNSDIEKYEKLSKEFELEKEECIRKYNKEIVLLESKKDDKVDIESIKSFWSLISKSELKIDDLLKNKSDLNDKLNDMKSKKQEYLLLMSSYKNKILNIDDKIKDFENKIDEWDKKRNRTCPTCSQHVNDDFINEKIGEIKLINDKKLENFNDEKNSLNNKIFDLNNKISVCDKAIGIINDKIKSIDLNIDKLNKSIKSNKIGKMTIAEAEKFNLLCENVNNQIDNYKNLIKEESLKSNNYSDLISDSNKKISKFNLEIGKFKSGQDEISNVANYLTYIYKSHSDKNKMRSFLISGSIPILNNRLAYYFNELNIDSDIKFNSTLQLVSDRWPYEYHSGGEKKRVDLALMCALYDTFIAIYGKQCNILVLDEIDKELDKEGVDEYVRLIIDDLSNRVNTIIVISHKNEISYAFPNQIKIKKVNDISFFDNQI